MPRGRARAGAGGYGGGRRRPLDGRLSAPIGPRLGKGVSDGGLRPSVRLCTHLLSSTRQFEPRARRGPAERTPSWGTKTDAIGWARRPRLPFQMTLQVILGHDRRRRPPRPSTASPGLTGLAAPPRARNE